VATNSGPLDLRGGLPYRPTLLLVAAAIPHHGPSSRLTASPIRESRTGFVAAQTFGATTRRRDRPGVVSVHRIRAVRLVSRYDRDHTRRFPELVKALGTLKAKSFALAGEVAVFDQALVSRWLRGRTADEPATLPVCIVFDVLELDGRDLRGKPLRERRRVHPHDAFTPRCEPQDAWRDRARPGAAPRA
jgi:hypothetical protein